MYEFDDLPLSPIEPATNVLVAGSAMSGARELFLETLAPSDGEGVIVISTNTGAEKLFTRLDSVGEGVDDEHAQAVRRRHPAGEHVEKAEHRR